MSLLDKAKDAVGKGGSSKGSAPAQGGAGKEDFGDKGLDAAEKKFGMSQSRETNERITDTGRDFIEKRTGKDIPDKFSN